MLIRKRGDEALSNADTAGKLIPRFERRKLPDDAGRLLILAPEEASFHVLNAAIKNEAIAQIFRKWINENRDSIRQLAMSIGGRQFDGKGAWGLLTSRLSDVRELYEDSEWTIRFFALRILLTDADGDARSARIAREAFQDTHPLLRALAAREFGNEYTKKLFPLLAAMALDDPVAELRQIARQRIDSIFPDKWTPDPDRIDALQAAHVLELQKTDSKSDENLAIRTLKGKFPRAVLAAARFLEITGALGRMLVNANLGDEVDWERRRELLSCAVSAGVHGFLNRLRTAKTLDVLLLGVKLLSKGGNPELKLALIKRVFNRRIDCSDERELYKTAIRLACSEGEKTFSLLKNELKRHRENPEILSIALSALPPSGASVYREPLIEFLRDPHFKYDELLLGLIAKLPPPMFLSPVLEILEGDRKLHARSVRIRALYCLGLWHLEYTLQTMLENLPILPPEKAADFAIHLASLDEELLKERAAFILSSQDARLKAVLISCLPADIVGDFTKKIGEHLSDADPKLRIACLRALANAGKLGTKYRALLKDPLESVRREAAWIAGAEGGVQLLKTMNFHGEVKTKILEGLAVSRNPRSVEVLIHLLSGEDSYQDEVIRALASKRDEKFIVALIEQFEKSGSLVKDKIAETIAIMVEECKEVLTALLSFNMNVSFLTDVFTRSGLVGLFIRRLGHRNPRVRREAAGLLAKIATESAFRGIVLAAGDPDKGVRMEVEGALDFLLSPAGEGIFEALERDPDCELRRRIRWVIEHGKSSEASSRVAERRGSNST